MDKIAFVFSGQGAQYQGMGKEIFQASKEAKKVFDISEKARPGTIKQCFEGDKEELSKTINTQPCLYTVDLAIGAALMEKGILPKGIAGFSLGEIAALAFAEAFSMEDGISLVTKRGVAMDLAAKEHPGKMVAVLGMEREKLEAIALECGVYPVNYNSKAQIAVAGEDEKLTEFSARIKEAKGKVIRLAVSGAFHSPFMEAAGDAMEEALKSINCKATSIPVYANTTAKPYPYKEKLPENYSVQADMKSNVAKITDEDIIKSLIVKQLQSPVRWQDTIEQMVEDGFNVFIEVGAGKTLTGLIKKIAPNVTAIGVENKEELENVKW